MPISRNVYPIHKVDKVVKRNNRMFCTFIVSIHWQNIFTPSALRISEIFVGELYIIWLGSIISGTGLIPVILTGPPKFIVIHFMLALSLLRVRL